MDETIKDAIGNREGMVIMNYTKLNESIEKCRKDKLNKVCRVTLKDLGIEFVD